MQNRDCILDVMRFLQYLSGEFADNNARGHRVTGRHARQNRAVSDMQIFDSVDLQLTVYDGHESRPILAVQV